ncbi:hypothetical protein [Haloarchaeobius sp. HRN-SO-5]|uniref:HEAT repeat domain-containing protein n=1 Tax=Haloarchaeobius sp. HRN-SO-5 TaxID=3446118 RepID=UPI003EB79601
MGLLGGSDDADRAEELYEIARNSPAAAADHVEELASLLKGSGPPARTRAADALYHTAGARPERVAEVVDVLLTHLADDDVNARRRTADALVAVAGGYPRTFAAWVESLVPVLSTTDPYVRAAVACVLAHLAASGPSTVLPAVDELRAATTDEEEWDVRVYATGALADVAERYPEEAAPVVPDAVANAREPVPALQVVAVDLLAAVAVADPSAASTEADEVFAELLREGAVEQRVAAACATGRVAVERPRRMQRSVSELATTTADDEERVRLAAATASVRVAQHHPDAVDLDDDAAQRLRGLADDLDVSVERVLGPPD